MLTCKVSLLGLISFFLAGLAFGGEVIPNWSAPATWRPARAHSGLTTMGDATSPLPFIGADPCRIADTRTAPGPYGAPALAGGAPRNFILAGQCGIPLGASAVSLNVTVANTQGPGFILMYPAGGSQPMVSTLNYVGGQTIANAAVVPLGSGGAVTVIAGVSGTDLILDTNGYYSSAPAASSDFFSVSTSGTSAIDGMTSSTVDLSHAILGVATGSSGMTFGVVGSNLSTTNGATGVFGFAEGTTGFVYGVKGVTSSLNGVGVVGVQGGGSGVIPKQAGVFGDSNGNPGVYGVSRSLGIQGVLVNSAGQSLSFGYLGVTPTLGVYFGNGLAGSGTKSFVEPHPTDASKVIRYVSLEGPESGTYFRGRARFQRGMATIELPESFRIVTDPESLSIQVTPIGEITGVAVMRIGIDGIVVKGSRDVGFFYLVHGVRRAYKDWDPIQENEKFFVPESPEAKLPRYLSEEERGRLIANGTYNADGTVNLETAERLGWVKMWADREAQAKAAAAANAAAHAARWPERK